MLNINPLIDSWREFQTIVLERAKYSLINPLQLYQNNAENGRITFLTPSYLYSNQIIPKSSSLLAKIDIDNILDNLKLDGFALGLNLNKTIVQEIWQLALSKPCYGNGDKQLSFYYFDKKAAEVEHAKTFVYGNYDNKNLVLTALNQLKNDPILLEIARQYLDAEPIHRENRLWWNFAVESSIYERRNAAQKFYYHLDRCRSIRFLFYLTDVDLCSSPYVCVRGSHIKKKLTHRFMNKGRSHQDIRQYYGYENIVPVCGKAGFGFVENPRCFHKGNPPGSKDRLALQIEFIAKT